MNSVPSETPGVDIPRLMEDTEERFCAQVGVGALPATEKRVARWEVDNSKTTCFDTLCASWAQSSVWCPVLRRQVVELVRSCTACTVERRNPSKLMIASETELRQWQKLGTDMFIHNMPTYLLLVDYASRYEERERERGGERENERVRERGRDRTTLTEHTSSDVILHRRYRPYIERRGIPETVVSDTERSMRVTRVCALFQWRRIRTLHQQHMVPSE